MDDIIKQNHISRNPQWIYIRYLCKLRHVVLKYCAKDKMFKVNQKVCNEIGVLFLQRNALCTKVILSVCPPVILVHRVKRAEKTEMAFKWRLHSVIMAVGMFKKMGTSPFNSTSNSGLSIFSVFVTPQVQVLLISAIKYWTPHFVKITTRWTRGRRWRRPGEGGSYSNFNFTDYRHELSVNRSVLPECDYVTFGFLLSQIRLSSLCRL